MDSDDFPPISGTIPAGYEPTAFFSGAVAGASEDPQLIPLGNSDPRVPLFNLSILGQKMESVHRLLSYSVQDKALIGTDQIEFVSTEIYSAIQQIILNGAALLSSSQTLNLRPEIAGNDPPSSLAAGKVIDLVGLNSPNGYPTPGKVPFPAHVTDPKNSPVYFFAENAVKSSDLQGPTSSADLKLPASSPCFGNLKNPSGLTVFQPDLKLPACFPADLRISPAVNRKSGNDDTGEIIEIDAVELLAEHIHICEICGKGFKRDANLRMHMRAHGNRFKTPEALAKPDRTAGSVTKTRFSCPFSGCNRNKSHKRFRPLKSVICVKNHYKRSHCPKMFSCNLCNKKSFSVIGDLKSHLKNCGAVRWRCTCGTSFSRKNKLFGHVALFEGHMPAVVDDKEEKLRGVICEEEEDEEEGEEDSGLLDGLLEEFGEIDGGNFDLEELLGFSGTIP